MKKLFKYDKLFVEILLDWVGFFVLFIPYILCVYPHIIRIYTDWKLVVISILMGMLLMIISQIIVHYLILPIINYKIWLHKNGIPWYRYLKPKWLNYISWKPGEKKIYRWLWWGYYKK